MSQYFPPYRSHGGDIKVELDLSNYATRTNLRNVTHVDVSSFASKTNLASLKNEVDEIDADKLKTVHADLAILSNVVKNDDVKTTEYNSLKTKVDRSDFQDKISKIDKKVLDVSDLVEKPDFNAKVTEIEREIPSISGLATNTALTAAENKIPDVSSLVKKTDYNTKISEIENKVNYHNHDKYIATPEFYTMAADDFKARLAAQTDLIRKPDFGSKLKGIIDRVTKNKTKYLLVENELKKLQKFNAAYLRGKNHFEEDSTKNYLVFSECTDILKGLQVLVVVIIYTFGNLKVCLMKDMILLLHLTIKLLQN